jgi:hypothetical protein
MLARRLFGDMDTGRSPHPACSAAHEICKAGDEVRPVSSTGPPGAGAGDHVRPFAEIGP